MRDRFLAVLGLTLALLLATAGCNSTDSDNDVEAAAQPAAGSTEPTAADAPMHDDAESAAAAAAKAKYDPNGKFAFELSELGTGARTDADGKRVPIRYEFCVPKRPDALSKLATLDPTVIVETRDKGEIACDDDHLMAHGDTGQPNYLLVLAELAKQDFIDKIILAD